MDQQELVKKTTEALRPFETTNLIDTIQHLTLHQLFTNPIILIIITIVFFFGIIKRSKTVLLTLFAFMGMIIIMRYAMPVPEEQLSFREIMPFVTGGIIIGGVIIYFSLVKSD